MARHKPRTNGGHTSGPRPNVGIFDSFKTFGYAGIFVVATVAATFNGFAEMWHEPVTDSRLFVLRWLLFGVVLILTFRWIIATHNEFTLWITWMDNPFQPQEAYGAIISLSVFLGLALAFPHRIAFVAALLTTGALMTYWTQSLCNEHFARALTKTRKQSVDATQGKILEVMRRYWLERPQLGRMAVLLFFLSIAFAFAFAGYFRSGGGRAAFELVAYVMLITTICGGEIVIARWRYVRDRDIRALLPDSL